ncbi:MFS transporter [Conservatibacter flavescens]|uniref:MFS transporter n=1 Tax=Conservatibacter flavescens TaxID=28161 RepID=A0A2M8S430_9PAST|nr:MFS transporter [Conservatibacter flavescens]PJG85905.1 MFS transporter [Conservatibacter flavescens]
MGLIQRKVWSIVFAAALILMITSGIRMSMGLFVSPLTEAGLNIVDVSLAMATMQLMWGVSQPITGAIADRYGAWKVICWGGMLLVIGLVITPFLLSSWGIILTLGLMVAFGAGAGSFSVLMGQVAQQTSLQQRGTASGILNAGGSFGQFIFSPFTQAFIHSPMFGWIGALYMLALTAFATLPLGKYLTKNVKFQPHFDTSMSGEQSFKQTILMAFRSRTYILLHLSFATCGFHVAFLVTHLPMEVSLQGLTAEVAAWTLAIIGIANVIGSLVVGWCVGRWRSTYILFWMYASRGILNIVYLLMPKTELTFYLFAIGLGLSWLATVPPTAALIAKSFGVRYLGTLFGLTLLSHQIGAFFGAYWGGLSMVETGDYTYMWYLDCVLAFFAAICHLFVKEAKVVRN